jgi:hypothetical protein
MEATVETQLASTRAAQQEFDQQMEPPAPADELVRLVTAAHQQLQGYDVPQAYLDVLAVANRIEWNGCQLYASRDRTFLTAAGRAKYAVRGLVEANEAWRAVDYNRGYVYYGESGLDLYRRNLGTNGFEICTQIGLTVVESFHTVDELLARVFELVLE